MTRKQRIDLAGYNHVLNRGGNGWSVFIEDEDYKTFLKIGSKACRIYRVILHDYCLMTNHFHLLIETQSKKLSSFM